MFNQPQLQSSLGEVSSMKTAKDRNWNMGTLALGKVVRVHPKRYTADVQLYGSHDILASTKSQEGRHSCRICVENAGFDPIHNKPYGKVVPIQKGSIVLVGFLGNTIEQPIIIRVLHHIGESLDNNNMGNILNASYNSDSDDTLTRFLNISPIQDFISIDEEGNFEVASHTKSFFVGKERLMDDEYYDYEDLEVKTPDNKTLHVAENYSKPKKYMAVFRDAFIDTITNWLKIIVDASKTSFRVAKLQQKANKSTYLEVDEDGAFTLRRQLDTKSFDKDNCKNYSEVTVQADGKIQISFIGATHTVFTINSDGSGVNLETTDDINITTEKDIHVKGKDMTVDGRDMTINGRDMNITSEGSIKMSAENSLDITANDIKIQSKGNTSINAGGNAEVQASQIRLN